MPKNGVLLLAAILAALAASASAGALTLQVLHMNDHHSTIEEDSFDLDVSSATGLPTNELAVKYGGFPRAITYMDSVTAQAANVLKLHAGDALSGTLWYSLFKGTADAQMMGYACFDAFALGNHEFDDGDANLAQFLNKLSTATQGCSG